MSIEGGAGRRWVWSVEAAGGKLKYLVDLFARDVELFDDFVDRGAGFRFSNTAETGMRVLRNTHAPFRRPGTLSTAEHFAQSSVGILVTLSLFRFYHASRLASRSMGTAKSPGREYQTFLFRSFFDHQPHTLSRLEAATRPYHRPESFIVRFWLRKSV